MDHRIKFKTWDIKSLHGTTGEYFCDIGFGKDFTPNFSCQIHTKFLVWHQKAEVIKKKKEKMTNWASSKL